SGSSVLSKLCDHAGVMPNSVMASCPIWFCIGCSLFTQLHELRVSIGDSQTRDWDHRRRLLFASALISADTVEASTGPLIRIRPSVANSISIPPALSGDGEGTIPGSGATATGLNAAGICARSQSCWRQRNNWLV